MVSWDQLSAQMDADVDAGVGDTISLSTDSGATWVDRQGYVLTFANEGTLSEYDEPLGSQTRVKMLKSYFGASGTPGRGIRLRHAKLGTGDFRPAGSEPLNQGRYVIFDVQKV